MQRPDISKLKELARRGNEYGYYETQDVIDVAGGLFNLIEYIEELEGQLEFKGEVNKAMRESMQAVTSALKVATDNP